MAKRKKPVSKMTDEELKRFVFPKKVVEEIRRIARENDGPGDSESDSSHDKSTR